MDNKTMINILRKELENKEEDTRYNIDYHSEKTKDYKEELDKILKMKIALNQMEDACKLKIVG